MKDIIYGHIAYWLPKKLVYFCAIRLGAHATTGKFSNTLVSELNFIEALKRWSVHNGR